MSEIVEASSLFCAAPALSAFALNSFAQSPAAPNASAQGPSAPTTAKQGLATFAGGCFWCVESDFDKVDGVISTTSGYTGGSLANPTYQQVSAGGTGHTEAVEVVYDPAKVSYEKLLDVFWRNHDPFAKNAQFCDHGSQYRAGIFYHDDEQRRLAEASKQRCRRASSSPSRPRSPPPARSTRPRTTTRTTT
jgi:peptide-methionine (S)-S-oxide reductase